MSKLYPLTGYRSLAGEPLTADDWREIYHALRALRYQIEMVVAVARPAWSGTRWGGWQTAPGGNTMATYPIPPLVSIYPFPTANSCHQCHKTRAFGIYRDSVGQEMQICEICIEELNYSPPFAILWPMPGANETYEGLTGPTGLCAILTEPEDRTFTRDLSPILRLLNRYATALKEVAANCGCGLAPIAREAIYPSPTPTFYCAVCESPACPHTP